MGQLKTQKSFTRLVKRILRNMVAVFENMETPDQNMWSPIEPTVPMYIRTTDSGYISNNQNNETKPAASENNKMVQTRLKRQDNRWNNRMDYELSSFWMSAESPYWPGKQKTLKKVDVDCLEHTTEELLKEVIKTVYHLYQDSCVKVDGTLHHIEQMIESKLSANPNETLSLTNNDTTDSKMNSNWKIQISSSSCEFDKDLDAQSSPEYSEISETSRLKFTAKQNSHLLHGGSRKLSDMLVNNHRRKKRSQKKTVISASNDNLYLSFYFTE